MKVGLEEEIYTYIIIIIIISVVINFIDYLTLQKECRRFRSPNIVPNTCSLLN